MSTRKIRCDMIGIIRHHNNGDKNMDKNSTKQIVGKLNAIGLNEKEAKVYLAALSLGPTTAQNIAEIAGIKRTTTYNIIDNLRNLGLMAVNYQGFKKNYSAAPPESLEAAINSKKEILKTVMPDLQSLYNLKGDESSIKYFKGLRACQEVYWGLLETIKLHDDYLVLTDQARWFALDPEFSQKFIEKRSKLNINIKLLFQDTLLAHEHKKFEQNYNEKIKILPNGEPLTTNLIITPQKVVIHQLVQPIFTMVIENKGIIQMNKEMFEIIWRSIA